METTRIQFLRSRLNDACAVLRAHGINAYEQGGQAVIFAASTSRWMPVASIPVPPDLTGASPDRLAAYLAMRVSGLVASPHSHEVAV
jgi:hypothetical protein